MNLKSPIPRAAHTDRAGSGATLAKRLFGGAFGLLLALAIVKFGNPVVVEKLVEKPANIFEWVLSAWPIHFGYWPLFTIVAGGLFIGHAWKPKDWMTAMAAFGPLLWLLWEGIAAIKSDDATISQATWVHFLTCVVCFYLGLFVLSGIKKLNLFWIAVAAGFVWTIYAGWEQHFGGLEQTQRYWTIYILPTLHDVPESFLKKMSSRRVFGTLFYPNAFAGIILLLLPALLGVVVSMRVVLTNGARWLLMGILAVGGLAALYWSGSKGGWLIMLLIGLVALAQGKFPLKMKIAITGLVLVAGLAGFFLKYASFFEKGATSVVARFDYWAAAGATFADHPVFGSGPGTFAKSYEQRKRPESEMAKLTHNDYLQQASDSGLPGVVLFTGFVALGLVQTARKGRLGENEVRLGVWLGLLAWAIQGFFEFGLYIPAIAWVAFGLMGWLLGTIQFDRPAKVS